MKMFLKGGWVERDERIDVVNPYSGDVFDTVPEAISTDVTEAVDEVLVLLPFLALEHGVFGPPVSCCKLVVTR